MSFNQRHRAAAKARLRDASGVRQLTFLVTIVVIVCALALGRVVLVPVAMAMLLCFLVAPLVDLLRGCRLGRIPSVVVAVTLGLAVMGSIGTLIGVQILQLATELPHYQTEVAKKIQLAQDVTAGRTFNLASKASTLLNRATGAVTASGAVPTDLMSADLASPAGKAPVSVAVQQTPLSPLELMEALLSPAARGVVSAAIVMVVAIFMLLQREDFRDRVIRLFGAQDLHRSTTAMDEAARRLSRYFLAQFSVNLGVGFIISTGLAILGVPGALLAGLLTALLRFVPYVGTWIGAAIALVLAATVPDWSMIPWTLALFVATDLIAAQIIEPRLYGKGTRLSPLAAIVAALFWSWIWGPMGLVLSTPITLSLVILGRHVEKLEFLEILLGAQTPLPAPANFYQRMLAGDSGEVLEQAQSLLKRMSPVDYYDTVVLEGLLLGHRDMSRGVILADQFARLNEALIDFIDGLEALMPPIASATSAPLQHGAEAKASQGIAGVPAETNMVVSPSRLVPPAVARVLCIAGRGWFDVPLAAATVQVMRRAGILAASARYDQFSRRAAMEVDLAAFATICVVSFDAPQCPRYVRLLLRQLHRHAPRAALILGFTSNPAQNTQVDCGAPVMMAPSFKTLVALPPFKREPGARAGVRPAQVR